MKKYLLLFCIGFILHFTCLGQSYNQEKISLENFLVRLYNDAPFEGVKVVSDYENHYLLSVVLVKNNANPSLSARNRVAQTKSARQVSQCLDGIIISESETIIRTTEKIKEEKSVIEIVDIIKEKSIGFTKGMEVLTAFDVDHGEAHCYMFYRKIEEM